MNSSKETFQEQSDDNQLLTNLIIKASRGDAEAFSKLISHPVVEDRISRISARILARYGSRGVYRDAADFEQEVYAKILSNLKSIASVRSESEFYAWASILARNIYIDSLRRSRLERKSLAEDETDASVGEHQYHETALRELLDKLDPRQRRILELHAEGYSSREIAGKLGISHSTAAKLTSQALKTILGEVDESTRRMRQSQIEIDQEKELTRHLINELRA